MKIMKPGRIALLAAALFIAPMVFESCASGPKSSNRHCKGKKSSNTKRMKSFAPGMAR